MLSSGYTTAEYSVFFPLLKARELSTCSVQFAKKSGIYRGFTYFMVLPAKRNSRGYYKKTRAKKCIVRQYYDKEFDCVGAFVTLHSCTPTDKFRRVNYHLPTDPSTPKNLSKKKRLNFNKPNIFPF